jgi:vacuolar protein sorting-associated protein 13A/C
VLIYPTESFICDTLAYSEDIALWVSFRGYKESKEVRIFSRKDRKGKMEIKLFKPNKGHLLLHLDYVKRSQNNRDIVIYCPYLIYNETEFAMRYRENGLTSNINSVDADVDQKGEHHHSKGNNKDQQRIIEEENVNNNLNGNLSSK